MDFRVHIKSILQQKSYGSSELLNCIIDSFLRYKDQILIDDIEWAFKQFNSIDKSMIIIHHFINYFEKNISTDFFKHLKTYINQWNKVNNITSEKFKEKFDIKNTNIITHSKSGMVINVLKQLKNYNFKVYQTNSEPGKEGIHQAKELKNSGINVELVLDQNVNSLMSKMNFFISGCDQYAKDGFINKVGTKSISESAKKYDIPVIIIADSRKEVKKLHVWSNLFEVIPFKKNITLICER